MTLRRLAALALAAGLLVVPGLCTSAAAAGGEAGVSVDQVKQSGQTLQVTVSLHSVDMTTVAADALRATVDGHPVKATLTGADTTRTGTPSVRRALLLLDTSGSMAGARIDSARVAANAFLDAAPRDVQVGLASMSSTTTVLVPPTADRAKVRAALAGLQAKGDTSLYDGVLAGVGSLGHQGQRLLVVLSDGADTTSHHTLDQAVAAVRASSVTVDAIGLQTSPAQGKVLASLAAAGHGRLLQATAGASLATAFRSTTRELVSSLTLSVAVPSGLTGKSVPLTVQLRTPSGVLTDTTTVLLAARSVAPGGTPTSPAAPPPAAASGQHLGFLASTPGLVLGLLSIFGALWLLFAAVLSWRPSGNRKAKKLLNRYTFARKAVVEEDKEASALGSTGLMHGALLLAERVARNGEREKKLVLLLDRAGMRLRPSEWRVIRAIGVLFGIAVFGFLSHSLWVGLIAGGVIGWVAPQAWLKRQARKRRAAFVDRLPDSLQLVVGSLGAGYSLLQALDGLVQEGEEPVAGEIGRALAQARLGIPIEEALEQVGDRIDSPDFSWTAMAIRIQREVGGNLGEVLLTVAETLRERAALRRQVRALSAEGRLSAYILMAIPTLMGLYELTFRREYATIMWTTPIGIGLLVMTVVLMVVGAFWMRKVVNVEV